MSDQLEAIMQAAERLRRVYSARDVAVVEETYVDDDGFDDDAHRLARFLMRIMPQAQRPVAMEKPKDWDEVQTGWGCNEHRDSFEVQQEWRQGGIWYRNADLEGGSRSGGPIYATEAEAWLELEWRYFDQWQKKVANAREGAARAR